MTAQHPKQSAMSDRRRLVVLIGVASILAALGVYWPGLSGGFLFDDFPNLVNASAWKITALDLPSLQRVLGADISGSIGRPLSMLTFGINHAFTGMDPFWLKLTNVLIHAISAWVVYLLAVSLVTTALQRNDDAIDPRFIAWAVAMFWALHPLQVSTVLYVVQRMELLAQLCVLSSVLCYVSGRRAQLNGRTALAWFIASPAFMLLGLGFKESALLAPVFIMLVEVCVFRFSGRHGAGVSRGWLVMHALAGITMLATYLVLVLPKYLAPSAYAARSFDLQERLWTQLPVLKMYLGQIALPSPDRLLFYYDQFPISSGLFGSAPAWPGALLLTTLLAIAVGAWRRWPLVSLGIGWFFAAHLLTSNVVPLELAFEHRNYLALLGVILALVTPAQAIGRRFNTDARRTVVVALVCGLGVLTLLEATTWGRPTELAMTHAGRNAGSARANYALGSELIRVANGDSNSPAWSMARGQFEAAAGLPHADILADQALIIIQARAGRDVSTQTWDRLRHKLTTRALSSQDYGALYAINRCRISGQCQFDDAQWLQTLFVLLEKHPRSALLHTYYANYVFNVLDDKPLGVRMMREATRLAPNNNSFRVGLLKFLMASNLQRNYLHEIEALVEHLSTANANGEFEVEIEAASQLLHAASPLLGEP